MNTLLQLYTKFHTRYSKLQIPMKFNLLFLDLFVLSFSWIFSCYLVWQFRPIANQFYFFLITIPILYFVKAFFFARLGLYNAILRYAGFRFAITMVRAVTLGCFVAYVGLYIALSPFVENLQNRQKIHHRLEIFILDWLLTLFLVAGSRFFPRYYSEISPLRATGQKRVLIYGAGNLGEAVARSLLKQQGEYLPIGFIDDDAKKLGKQLHNLPILGSRAELTQLIKLHHINELVIAITNTPAEWLRAIIKTCRLENVFCRIAPKISDMLDHDINIKNIDIVDLLKRDPKDLDKKQLEWFLQKKKILVSGAAGSIGSELIRQALTYHPAELLLVDFSEYGLYSLQEEFQDHIKNGVIAFKFILLNLCHKTDLDHLIANEKPDIILHAAAYKHVPLLEDNPYMGVANNIQGTMNLANAAHSYGVSKFVMISTDKAVRPTNVMGATKRICELYIQNLNLKSSTEFVAVRFGNVLGSSGSVIPKFLKQIKTGGPITVTHPDITRYFMLIQEAAALTLQAAAIGHGGEIFILNMGEPVKIKEMAEDLIFLAGKTPYKDIDIQFTGLRSGEKLYEELLIDEAEKKTQYANITIGRMTVLDWDQLTSKIQTLIEATQNRDRQQLLSLIRDLVPEFNHLDLPQSSSPSNLVHLRTA